MEGQEMAYATLQECSVGQPKYRVEVYYDDKGECYFRNGWPKFFVDYSVHAGWFLSPPVTTGGETSSSTSSMASSAPALSPPGHEGKHPAALSPTWISSTSSTDFSGTKSMRRPCHDKEGERLYDEKC
jgi:hypothetical protein